jgi:hypothetical protein
MFYPINIVPRSQYFVSKSSLAPQRLRPACVPSGKQLTYIRFFTLIPFLLILHFKIYCILFFVWVRNLVADIEGGTQAECV